MEIAAAVISGVRLKKTPECPYCGRDSKLVSGARVYPNRPDLARKMIYECKPCDARVGTHPDGRPLGRLANRELRYWKIRAHAAFDPHWKGSQTKRARAYQWLASELQIPVEDCHIGAFDVEMCKRVIEVCDGNVER